MGFFQAGHLIAKRESGGEKRIGRRDHAVAVVDRVRRRKRILLPQIVIRAHGPEIFVDRILGIIERLLGARRQLDPGRLPVHQLVDEDLGTIGIGPQRHVLQHVFVQIGDECVSARGRIRKESLTRLLVRNRADAGGRQALAVPFVVAEQK